MAAPKGNKNAIGNRGGGSHTVKETIWHKEKWELDTFVCELEDKVESGTYAIRDIWLLKALQGNDKILRQAADKVLANLLDVTSSDDSFKPNPEMQELATELKAIIKAKYGAGD